MLLTVVLWNWVLVAHCNPNKSIFTLAVLISFSHFPIPSLLLLCDYLPHKPLLSSCSEGIQYITGFPFTIILTIFSSFPLGWHSSSMDPSLSPTLFFMEHVFQWSPEKIFSLEFWRHSPVFFGFQLGLQDSECFILDTVLNLFFSLESFRIFTFF